LPSTDHRSRKRSWSSRNACGGLARSPKCFKKEQRGQGRAGETDGSVGEVAGGY
jgi:hypothetical protein